MQFGILRPVVQRGTMFLIVHQELGMASEALSIKVWVEGNKLEIEGAIPISGDDIQSITSRCSG